MTLKVAKLVQDAFQEESPATVPHPGIMGSESASCVLTTRGAKWSWLFFFEHRRHDSAPGSTIQMEKQPTHPPQVDCCKSQLDRCKAQLRHHKFGMRSCMQVPGAAATSCELLAGYHWSSWDALLYASAVGRWLLCPLTRPPLLFLPLCCCCGCLSQNLEVGLALRLFCVGMH